MSISSDSSSARRLSQHSHVTQGEADIQKQPESRRNSKYEIYGTATRPFGESYRRSLLLQQQDQDQSEDSGVPAQEGGVAETPPGSPLDTDSVDDTMGCSTSRTQVAVGEETVRGTFVPAEAKLELPAKSDVKVNGVVMKTINNNTINNYKGLSDFEIVYGTEKKITNSNSDEGYSTTDIYSEVKKPEKNENPTNQTDQKKNRTPREKLMQQIRDRRDEKKEIKESGYCSVTAMHKKIKDERIPRIEKESKQENEMPCTKYEIPNNSATSAPVSFVEEEYSYEPDKKEATSKLVVRSRSLVNLDQSQPECNNVCTLKRPNKLKITTKPDGTIRYGLRQGSQDADLMDDLDGSPPHESEIKNNYVSSIKSAFDAAIESQNKDKTGRAEAFDGLRQYFHDNKHGLQELLINNNVVIIEPFRPDPPKSPSEKSDTSSQRTCRITGATIKSPNGDPNKRFMPSNTLPRRHTKCKQTSKQGFYHPIKVNKELIDAELPDPDKVKNAKELFEKIFKSRSSSETPKKKTPTKSFFNTITSKMRITPEVKVVQPGKQTSTDRRRQNRLLIDPAVRDDMKRCTLQRRWTDSGSLSSGVSSDLSCDQDYDYYHHETSNNGTNQGILEEYSSDEDDVEYIYPYDDTERHPVSSEVLQKIRACGTTITYYGGRIISRSHGQFRSPMTMTIMDEIRKNGGTNEGRKKFEEQEPSLGVKFRLVKSHSCGSRLEIAGTEDDLTTRLTSPRHESFRGKSIAEEVAETKEERKSKDVDEDNQTSLEEEEDKAEADRYVTNVHVESRQSPPPPVMTWAELKLKEARKQWHCAPEAVRIPPQDMEFETFEVLDDSPSLKQEKNETGRG